MQPQAVSVRPHYRPYIIALFVVLAGALATEVASATPAGTPTMQSSSIDSSDHCPNGSEAC